jgi:MFS family permease
MWGWRIASASADLPNLNMRDVATPPARLPRATKKRRRSASMRTTHRRYWVFFLLFLFSGIAYVDRVNMSVAGKPIAHEFGLSPIALGYLFSSFLWAYVLMMLPGGRLIDHWGPHVVASVATAVWSTAQMVTGMVGSFAAMLIVRLGLGVGEAPFAPISYSSVRLWSPYTERGTAIAAISCGSTLGLALGAPAGADGRSRTSSPARRFSSTVRATCSATPS